MNDPERFGSSRDSKLTKTAYPRLGCIRQAPWQLRERGALELHRSGCSLLVCNVISPGVCVAALGRRPNMQQASCSHVANLHDAADADENEVEEEEELVIAVDKRRMIELRNLGVPQRKVQAQSASTSDMYRIIVFYYFARRTHLAAGTCSEPGESTMQTVGIGSNLHI